MVILVVDDDPALRRMIQMWLFSDGFDVVTAADGLDALEVLREQPVDAVILDLEMPRMDGREFFTTLRNRGIPTPVLILSAYGAAAALADLHAEAAIAKPFDPNALLQEVNRLVARA